MELFRKIDEYKELLDRKVSLEEETKENNAHIDSMKKEIADLMVESECPRISRKGFTYSLQQKTRYSKKGGADEQLFEILRENGLGDIIKETVNAQTLQSTISSMVEEQGELPEDFVEVINVFEAYDIMKRKETNKNAQQQEEAV